jgi:hypothetical protein
MIAALVAGELFRNAESRTSKAGKTFISATCRVKDGEQSRFVRITAFSHSAQAELPVCRRHLRRPPASLPTKPSASPARANSGDEITAMQRTRLANRLLLM